MKAPVKAGRESRMQEPHKKGIANHLDPESCAEAGNRLGEALTGAHVGQPSSSEITSPGVPTLYGEGEGHIRDGVRREPSRDATESETLGMRGNSLHGNRETPKASATPNPLAGNGAAERSEKAYGRTSDRHAFGESDGSIVPQKQANKADVSAAESVEERGPTQGNDLPAGHSAGQAWPWTAGHTRSRIRGGSSWTRGRSRMGERPGSSI